MKIETANFVVHTIADRVGVAVQARLRTDAEGEFCDLVPMDGHPNESFAIRFRLGWRSAEAVFVPGRFALPLISRMGHSSQEQQHTFVAFACGLAARKVKLFMRLNGLEANPLQPTSWPADWTGLELSFKLTPLLVEPENEAQHERLLLDLVVPMFGMMAVLIGVEENEPPTTGEPEGRAIQTLSTRYERKKLNREACIQLKGTRCCVCAFDFAECYGTLGINYVEIHHLTPVAQLGPDYVIDVATDLVPLCSNCHAMAHREEPPIEIARLKELVLERRRVAAGFTQDDGPTY